MARLKDEAHYCSNFEPVSQSGLCHDRAPCGTGVRVREAAVRGESVAVKEFIVEKGGLL